MKVTKINMKLEFLKSEFSISCATFYVTGDELSSLTLSLFSHMSVFGFRSLFTLLQSEHFVSGMSLHDHLRLPSSELWR